jgi:hypothetical protein
VSGSVIGDDVLYSIGGGRAVSMGGAGNMQSIGVGVGWNSNLICGDMSITTTLQNQLNGITNGFQQIMSNVIQSATSAVASLPALIIQRADPGLYNLLTNGVLQARLDFDRSKLTCRPWPIDGGHGRRPGRLGPARRRHGAARCGEQHRCRVRRRAGRIEQGQQRRALGGRRQRGRLGPGFDQGGRRRDPRGLQPAQRPRRPTPRPSRARPAATA